MLFHLLSGAKLRLFQEVRSGREPRFSRRWVGGVEIGAECANAAI